ncbi:MAG: hypothetical protein RKO66_12135 [Candidatus Contendobacter sp.]|nr:hypothetical protein [Candidatus Contendobacter sp.]MDS4058239.1 hypothetical protein [Candidatus Contendobacter sp.]
MESRRFLHDLIVAIPANDGFECQHNLDLARSDIPIGLLILGILAAFTTADLPLSIRLFPIRSTVSVAE